MENELKFKMHNTYLLSKDELIKTEGGVIELMILQIYLHRNEINDFMRGFVDGFRENKT